MGSKTARRTAERHFPIFHLRSTVFIEIEFTCTRIRVSWFIISPKFGERARQDVPADQVPKEPTCTIESCLSALQFPVCPSALGPMARAVSPEALTTAKLRVLSKAKSTLLAGGNPATLQKSAHTALDLNTASDDDIVNILSNVFGVGTLSVNRIITQRFVDGSYQDERDFNRRVRHMRFKRLYALGLAAGVNITLGPPTSANKTQNLASVIVEELHHGRRKKNRVKNRKGPTDALVIKENMLKEKNESKDRNATSDQRDKSKSIANFAPSSLAPREPSLISLAPMTSVTVTVASWNTARLSPYGRKFWKKIDHAVTLVKDSKADIVALQEVHPDALGTLCRVFTEATGCSWIAKNDSFGQTSDASLALLVRSSNIYLRQITPQNLKLKVNPARIVKRLDKNIPSIMNLMRPPQVFTVRMLRDGFPAVEMTLANVHISQMQARAELNLLAQNIASAGNELSVVDVVIGDFNASASESSTNGLRQAGFIEIFNRQGVSYDGSFGAVSSSTTVAGRWLDNFWVRKEFRPNVCDAWCFELSARRRSLKQSPRAYAAGRRAASSDHLPLVVVIDLPHNQTVHRE